MNETTDRRPVWQWIQRVAALQTILPASLVGASLALLSKLWTSLSDGARGVILGIGIMLIVVAIALTVVALIKRRKKSSMGTQGRPDRPSRPGLPRTVRRAATTLRAAAQRLLQTWIPAFDSSTNVEKLDAAEAGFRSDLRTVGAEADRLKVDYPIFRREVAYLAKQVSQWAFMGHDDKSVESLRQGWTGPETISCLESIIAACDDILEGDIEGLDQ